MKSIKDFWYVVAESKELKKNDVLARKVMGEWLAVFRDENGEVVIMQDRCKHRAAQLSKGKVCNGKLECPYHGWTYGKDGHVVSVPSEGENFKQTASRKGLTYRTCEQDDYIYVCLSDSEELEAKPFPMRHYGEKGWHTIRLQNHFENNVTNCVENFIDIPHTVYVHPGIFRTPRRQKIDVDVRRYGGVVKATYHNETDNLGWFSKVLNPKGGTITHTDEFLMPNVSCVEYIFGPNRHFIITSQSIPQEDDQTLVYTDLTFNYGIWNKLAAPIVKWQGQKVIDQDIEALANQMEVIKKYGDKFSNTPADVIHVWVESIQKELAEGRDPRLLPERNKSVSMLV
ncbi:MAG: aromatic ring-hydroxylating dioxygenase subunit alpha [Pseudomonadales bacterium]|nr:aromatic ring-hydroxylating dioxygenase subunit alpha [Pseudomonadales bacterium]